MDKKRRISILRERAGQIRDWMKDHYLPPKLVFTILGVISTFWFIIRVIPRPSRAAYPCMKVAAPLMSGFVVYLLSLGGFTILIRKARKNFLQTRYIAAVSLLFVALIAVILVIGQNSQTSYAGSLNKSGPDDGPNQPMGTGNGVNPGRVVWVWNPKATNADCINVYNFYKPENTNQGVVNKMVVDGITNLSGKTNLSESWDALFRSFNYKKGKQDKGYTRGEKFFIKINQGTANGKLRRIDRNNGFDIPKRITESQQAKEGKYGTCEAYPNVVLEILRELVYVVGVDQKDIAIGDPISHIYGHNYEVWATEFPEVVYVDKTSTLFGRTMITATAEDLIFYSDKNQSDKLFDVIENADYLINVANLKPHGRAGISLTAKNHFGSHARRSAFHMHHSLISPFSVGSPTNGGYRKYRVMVDLMGSKYLGQNTLLYVVDALYGGGSIETKVPVKYYMPPFNNDWSNSIFLSQDQVALESVCFDFLRTEWNGTYTHNPANNIHGLMSNVNGVDDYLHQAADASNWPEGIIYDPDNSGKPLGSLGAHEHWNNAAKKQYSRNLGFSQGIELVSVPDTLVGGNGPEVSTSENWYPDTPVINDSISLSAQVIPASSLRNTEAGRYFGKTAIEHSFNGAFQAKRFHSIVVDDDNVKWFLTEVGIVSFDGEEWKIHNENKRIPSLDVKDIAYDYSDYGKELWMATPMGAMVASIPVDARSGATTYYLENSTIISENVVSLTVGKGSLRWFGTDKGISAFYNNKWLTSAYQRKYPEFIFDDFPITSMATSPDGDSLYVATVGAGVTRVFRNDVDAITGASEYAQWGPIKMPSDNVYSVCIAPDGTQWFGTDAGVARHIGYNTLENWAVFNEDNGLVDNFVQAIAADTRGMVWFGTKGGVSVFDNVSMRSVTEKDGLTSNNVLCISVDKEGVVWIGTDAGVTSFGRGQITKYTE